MDSFEKHTVSPNPSMLVDFESMLAQSKRDQFLWTALSVVIFTLIVIAWPAGLGPLDTSADIVWLFARRLLPVVLCLSLQILLVWIHLRMEAILQRGLNEQTTAEIIDLTSNLRGGDAKRLATDLLWLRAAFSKDPQARAFLAGDDWHDHPPTPYIRYDELAAKRPRSRMHFYTIVLLASGVSVVATFLLKTFEFAATHGSSVRLSTTAALGLQAVGVLVIVGLTAYLFFEAHLEQQEGKKPIPQLVESWLSGNERARKALRRRARTHLELHQIAERCGWRTRRD